MLLTYVCGLCGQVPAKGLAGLMGGLELVKGAWLHSGVINESLLRKKWEGISRNRSVEELTSVKTKSKTSLVQRIAIDLDMKMEGDPGK